MNSFIRRSRRIAGTAGVAWYRHFLKPRATDEDTKRREYIFNILVSGSLVLTMTAYLLTVFSALTEDTKYNGLSPMVMLLAVLFLSILYSASRYHFTNAIAYTFLLLFVSFATYGLYIYGFEIAQSLLTYVLVIIMAGILISSRAAIKIGIIILLCLGVISYLQTHGIVHPNLKQFYDPLAPSHVALYACMFIVIISVTWLSNRDIESSLLRVRQSEAELRRERNTLEVKVRERTRELERAQVEKMLELHRFAEFGRLSSTLLHELANPVTSVSIELEQLESSGHAGNIGLARKGIAHIEQYIDAARRQLRNESEVKAFDSCAEVKRVVGFLEPVAKKQGVIIETELQRGLTLYGDSIKFNQIMANLVANAIDAYYNDPLLERSKVRVSSQRRQHKLEIIVHDRGVGIPAAERSKIFEPFYTTKTSPRGTGIGLTITRRMVREDFHGTINVSSGRRTGTSFKVVMPLYEK